MALGTKWTFTASASVHILHIESGAGPLFVDFMDKGIAQDK